jgi:hypothetical protein
MGDHWDPSRRLIRCPKRHCRAGGDGLISFLSSPAGLVLSPALPRPPRSARKMFVLPGRVFLQLFRQLASLHDMGKSRKCWDRPVGRSALPLTTPTTPLQCFRRMWGCCFGAVFLQGWPGWPQAQKMQWPHGPDGHLTLHVTDWPGPVRIPQLLTYTGLRILRFT